MPPLPSRRAFLFALLTASLLSAAASFSAHAVGPAACSGLEPYLAPARCAKLAPWQLDLFARALREAAWRRENGVTEQAWGALAPAAKGELVFKKLREETGRRLSEEIAALHEKARHWDEGTEKPTVQDKQAFIEKVYSWKERYPFAELVPSAEKTGEQVGGVAVLLQQELLYKEAHPGLLERAKDLEAVRSAQKAVAGGADAAALDTLYQKGGGSGSPAGGTVAGRTGLKSQPAVGKGGTASIDGVVSSAVRWRFEAGEPEGLGKVGQALRKLTGAAAREERFIREAMGGLTTPVEREVLAEVAAAQSEAEQDRARALAAAAGRLKEIDAALKTPLPGTTRERLERLREEQAERLALLETLSPELVVSPGDFPDFQVGARVFVEDKPGPDGRRRVRLVFNRRFLEAPAKDNPKDAARKLTTHELTHVADLLRRSRGAGPSARWLEPRGFRNGVMSYQEEGRPKGELVAFFAGVDHGVLSRDPVAWMHFQQTRYPVVMDREPWKLFAPESLTPDDIARPDQALSWRMQYVYLYATRQASPQGGTREEHLRAVAGEFNFKPDLADLLVAVDGDTSVPELDKSREFARRAAATGQGSGWSGSLAKVPKEDYRKLVEEEAEFFDRLMPLTP